MNIWDDQELLVKLEEQRDRLREAGKRMSFDCFNLWFRHKDMKTYCSKGKLLSRSKDGGLGILVVLRGICSGVCAKCPDFSTED